MLCCKFFLIAVVPCIFFTQAFSQPKKIDSVKVVKNNIPLIAKSKRIISAEPNATQKITAHYDSLEKNVETQYAKLISETKNNKLALEDQNKQLDKEIGRLKERIKKLDIAMQQTQKLLLAATDSGRSARSYVVYKDSIAYYNKEIQARNKKRSALRSQIKVIDKTIADLQIAKEKEIAAIRKQKQKALSEATGKN